MDREIHFVKGKVGPICLPGPEMRDSDTEAQVTVVRIQNFQ